MPNLIVYGEGNRPAYAVSAVELPGDLVEPLADQGALRGNGPVDAIEQLEAAGQAIADACEHLLGRVREGLSGAIPAELEITFNVTLAGEGGIPLIGKASAEAGFEVRAMWQNQSGSTEPQ